MQIVDYLMDRVSPEPNTGCWLWTAHATQKPGGLLYGYARLHNKASRAHRLSYETFVGPIPTGLCVCHSCDVSLCVNPAHLFLGTHQDNYDDARRKGRHQYGVRNGNAKLTPEAVRIIRATPTRAHMARRTLADRFGIDTTHVAKIKRRELWKEVS